MSYFSQALLVLMFFFYLSIVAVESNVPYYDSEAGSVIPFVTTRRVEDGALKESLLKMLKDAFDIQIFVESGTHLGRTTLNAAAIFDKVHSVELSLYYYEKAAELFRNTDNVFIYWGDSANLFAEILDGTDSRALFYLDGHYSGGDTAQGSSNTPILQELASIRQTNQSNGIILVDDVRCFQQSCYPEKFCDTHLEGYPDLRELIEAILDVNPTYQICFLGDALLAYPRDDSVCVSPVVNACAVHRLSSVFSCFSEEELQQADLTIATAGSDERLELKEYYTVYSPWEIEMGLRSYAAFWYGLIVYYDGDRDTAFSLFQQTAGSSMPGWRVNDIIQGALKGALFEQEPDVMETKSI